MVCSGGCGISSSWLYNLKQDTGRKKMNNGYFRIFLISQSTNAIIRISIIIPTHIPALKISPITSHPVSVVDNTTNKTTGKKIFLFIHFFLSITFLFNWLPNETK